MRPTKYKKEYCETIKEVMKDGASIEEVAAEIGIAKSTLYLWADEHDEFSDAKKEGEELSKAWWMRQGRINLENTKFSATLFYMNMKNRHGWKDKQEINQNVIIKPEELYAEFGAAIRDAANVNTETA